MVDSKDSSITVNDDWEDAVDSGEFEKQLKQQIKQRVATQEVAFTPISTPANTETSSKQPIRILKRPSNPDMKQSGTHSNDLNSQRIFSNSSSLQTNKNSAKTYEQREIEYRLARRRIMGDEGEEDSEQTKSTMETTSTASTSKTSVDD